MSDKLSEKTDNNICSANKDNKKIVLTTNKETPVTKIILINCILDFNSFMKNNFKESNKGYLGLSLISLFFLNRKRPFIYNIKNNYQFSNSLIVKNKIIKVNPIKNNIERKLYSGQKSAIQNFNFRFSYSFEYRHINNAYNKLYNFKNLFTNLTNKASIITENNDNFREKINHENKLNNNISYKDNERKQLEILTGIEVKLCGIKDLNEEGRKIAEKLIYDNNSKIYLQFNHILYMDTPEIYCWIYLKNKKFSYSQINLNIFLVKQGLANVNPVKLNDVFDEKIYYNYSDLIEAERNAKEKGMGIWENKRSKVIRESSIKNERFGSFFERFAKRLNMSGWEKSILNK